MDIAWLNWLKRGLDKAKIAGSSPAAMINLATQLVKKLEYKRIVNE